MKMPACLPACLTLALASAGGTGCIQRVFEVPSATPIFVQQVDLRRRVTYTFRTEDLEGAAPDTVMHLVRGYSDWVASNDECPDGGAGAHGSCITYRPPGGLWPLDPFYIIVHAYSTGMASTGTVVVEGSDGTTLRFRDVVFAGVSFKRPEYDVGWTDADEILSVSPPGGPDRSTCMLLEYPSGPADRNGVRLRAADWRGQWLGGCWLRPGSGSSQQGNWLLAGVAQGTAPAPLTIYVNDRATDMDGDALGNDLESQVHTCNGRSDDDDCFSPFPVVNGFDTDRDGLRDDWELLGRSPSLTLPHWGADPRHKDAFLELDRHDGVTLIGPAEAEELAAGYADGPANVLQNPDMRDGLAVHVDAGIPGCVDGVCSTVYGDWGGHSVVPRTIPYYAAEGDPAYFDPDRAGIFWYGLVSSGTGGTTGEGSNSFVVGRYAGFGGNAVHELGHLLGVGHGGTGYQAAFNCKPNYRSVMNYCFPSLGGFSDGTRSSLNPTWLFEAAGVGADPGYFASIWRVATDGTAVDWNRDLLADTHPGHSVLGYPMWAVDASSESLQYYPNVLNGDLVGAYPDKSPGVAVLDDKVWILYRTNAGDDLAYVEFTPHPDFGWGLRHCWRARPREDSCGVFSPREVIEESLSSSPMFTTGSCPRCDDGVESDRLIGVYARGLDEGARYYVRSIDRTGATAVFELPGARPATFDNRSPYTDSDERAVADPAVAYHLMSISPSLPPIPLLFVVYRHPDGTLHQLVLSVSDMWLIAPDAPIDVAGNPAPVTDSLGPDPAVISFESTVRLYYARGPEGHLRALRWLQDNRWAEESPDPFGSRNIDLLAQPGVVHSAAGLPPAIRIELRSPYRADGIDFDMLYRDWTDPAGIFANESFAHNKWYGAYRGGSRLALYRDTEVAAEIGLYDSRPLSLEPDGSNATCMDCDCHKGMRRLAGGTTAGCGRPDDDPRPDLAACNCPNARGILFRPLADGVVNATLDDQNDWLQIPAGVCLNLRDRCEDCYAPGTTCILGPPIRCSTWEPRQPAE